MSNEVTESTVKSIPVEEQKPQADPNTIQKVKDELNKLPHIWLEKPTLAAFLDEVFGVSVLKERVKTYGAKALMDSVVSSNGREYLYALDTVLSLLAPTTPFTNISHFLRNVAMLDSMIGVMSDKIDRSCVLSHYSKISQSLKSLQDCPIRINDYYIDTYYNVPMAGMFMVMVSTYPVGTVLELKSDAFNRTGSESNVIHCKLLYRNATMEQDDYGYFVRSTVSTFAIVAAIEEYDMKIFLSVHTTADRHDLTIRRVSVSGTNIYGLYEKVKHPEYNTPSFTCTMDWCIGLPFSMVDFRKYYCLVFGGGVGIKDRDRFTKKAENDIFDKNTNALVKRIIHADAMGYSRAYALVGIPGTGKTFIMTKLVKENKDAAVLTPNFPGEGMTFEYLNYLERIISSIANKHIYVLLDDFDKFMSDDENSGKTNQNLIFFFDFLHRECPGGVDDNGNIRKTFTLIATMNNPKILANAIIKRSERFDEVIEIGLPQSFIYGKRLNMIKDAGDRTNYDSVKFRPVYWYMRRKVITLADIGNVYAIMKTHRNKECNDCTYGIMDLLYAVKFIGKNRKAASKEYAI
jgi:hypothetical protein